MDSSDHDREQLSVARRLLAPVALRRQAWWLVWALLGGWLIVYNVFRIARSDAPRAAALPSLPLGILLGLGIFAAYVSIFRVLARRQVVQSDLSATPSALRVEGSERLVRGLLIAAAVLAVVAGALGAALLVQWWAADPGDRGKTKLVIAVWDLLLAAWLAMEIPALARLASGRDEPSVESIDGMPLAAVVTCVLAAVGISRDLISPAQVVLIVVAGVVAVIAHVALARLVGRRGIVLAAVGAGAIAALSLAAPLLG